MKSWRGVGRLSLIMLGAGVVLVTMLAACMGTTPTPATPQGVDQGASAVPSAQTIAFEGGQDVADLGRFIIAEVSPPETEGATESQDTARGHASSPFNPTSAASGELVTFSGQAAPNTYMSAYLYCEAYCGWPHLGVAPVAPNGSYSLTFRVPSQAKPGRVWVAAGCDACGNSWRWFGPMTLLEPRVLADRRLFAEAMVRLAYGKLAGYQPGPDTVEKYVAGYLAGHLTRGNRTYPLLSGDDLWAAVATSPEVEDRLKHFAPIPFRYGEEFFGYPRAEQCFGDIGPGKCAGLPIYPHGPTWTDLFQRPDGVWMAYVIKSAAVGSILHDNVCHRRLATNSRGAYCEEGQGEWGAGNDDGITTWRKAVYNTRDNRYWHHRFGPYPVVPPRAYLNWSDDVRQVRNRDTQVNLDSVGQNWQWFYGGETKSTLAIKAPRKTPLDTMDAAFCASGAFESPPWPGTYGTCR